MKYILAILLLAAGLQAAPAGATLSWPYTLELADTATTITIQHYYGSALKSTRTATLTASVTDTFALEWGYLNQIVYLIKWVGLDSTAGFVVYRDLDTSYANPEVWTVRGVHWPDATDSAQLEVLREGLLDRLVMRSPTGIVRTAYTLQSWDTTLYAYAGQVTEARYTLYYPNQTPTTWTFMLDLSDTTKSSTSGTGTAIANSCLISGQIFYDDGSKVWGADVIAVPGAGMNMTGYDGTNRYVISSRARGCKTDSTGRYSFYLIGTHEYADTTQGMYTITAKKGTHQILDIKNLWIPSSGTLNLADTVASRRR